MAHAGAALNITLQGLQQMALAGVAQEEVGAAAQVFLQLPALAFRHRLQWALAQAGGPQSGRQQQAQGQQGFGEMPQQ